MLSYSVWWSSFTIPYVGWVWQKFAAFYWHLCATSHLEVKLRSGVGGDGVAHEVTFHFQIPSPNHFVLLLVLSVLCRLQRATHGHTNPEQPPRTVRLTQLY